MFDDVQSAIAYIEAKRTKRTFCDFKEILKKYQLPVDLKKVIHVAGTNGKGSTTIFMRDLLMKQGFNVGTFTSPYVISHHERIAVNGKPISDEDLLKIINQLYDMIEEQHLSMFEIDVCIMLVYFSQLQLDYHIIECGIGGLLDKTNVLDGDVAVITNIGKDHQFMLGQTLMEIAKHKAGIIKHDKVLFTTEKKPEILHYFQQVCKEKNCQFFYVKTIENPVYPYRFELQGQTLQMNLPGYQLTNFMLAYQVVNYLEKTDPHCLQSVIDDFFWPCRFEKIGQFYLDGAHNVDGIRALLETISSQQLQDVGFVISILSDKDQKGMLDLLQGHNWLQSSFDDERSDGDFLPFDQALKIMAQKHRHVVVTGSLHFVSSVRQYLMTKGND